MTDKLRLMINVIFGKNLALKMKSVADHPVVLDHSASAQTAERTSTRQDLGGNATGTEPVKTRAARSSTDDGPGPIPSDLLAMFPLARQAPDQLWLLVPVTPPRCTISVPAVDPARTQGHDRDARTFRSRRAKLQTLTQ